MDVEGVWVVKSDGAEKIQEQSAGELGGQATQDQITAQFSEDDQRQEDSQAGLEHSCQQAEGVADDGQPGEEQGPDAIALVETTGPGLAALVHAQDTLHEKEAAVEPDGIGGAGAQAVADGGGGQGREPGGAVRDQGHEQPFRAQRQDGGRQEHAFETGSEVRNGLSWWINFYNKKRPHSQLDDSTPNEAFYKKCRPGYAGRDIQLAA